MFGADSRFPNEAGLECERELLIIKMDPSISGSAPGYCAGSGAFSAKVTCAVASTNRANRAFVTG